MHGQIKKLPNSKTATINTQATHTLQSIIQFKKKTAIVIAQSHYCGHVLCWGLFLLQYWALEKMAGKCVSVHAYKFTAARGAVIAFFGCKHLFFHCLKLVCPVWPLRLARPFPPYNCRSSDIFSSQFDSLSLSPAVHPCVFSSFCSNIKTDFPLKRTLLLFPAAVWAPFNAWTFLSFLLIDQFMSTQRGSDGRRQRRHWLLSEHFAKEAQVSGPQCKANKEINFFFPSFRNRWSWDSKCFEGQCTASLPDADTVAAESEEENEANQSLTNP